MRVHEHFGDPMKASGPVLMFFLQYSSKRTQKKILVVGASVLTISQHIMGMLEKGFNGLGLIFLAIFFI